DVILVGDSLGMVVLGFEDTLSVTVEDMVRHTAAVARARPRALVVADMPWLSYHTGSADAVRNAGALVRAGAGAVKLEGGLRRVEVVEALVSAEIPVMGHLGLNPQSIHSVGGYKIQGRAAAEALALRDAAVALVEAGCFSLVLEGIPDGVGRLLTEAVDVPTIGIGAGPFCDGQVLVFHDVLGLEDRALPRFVRRYASLKEEAVKALGTWAEDVRGGHFPSAEESYPLDPGVASELGLS
ncbi:MAG: 3-methyl-2-oxobutanoate hydroxymethyltransferase, partial [Acidimicrobiales bacterium]